MVKNNNQILGICGSPRKQGTEYALQYALNYSSEKFGFDTEFWSVKNKKIAFCTHCDYCIREKRGCINEDDMQELYQLQLFYLLYLYFLLHDLMHSENLRVDYNNMNQYLQQSLQYVKLIKSKKELQ